MHISAKAVDSIGERRHGRRLRLIMTNVLKSSACSKRPAKKSPCRKKYISKTKVSSVWYYCGLQSSAPDADAFLLEKNVGVLALSFPRTTYMCIDLHSLTSLMLMFWNSLQNSPNPKPKPNPIQIQVQALALALALALHLSVSVCVCVCKHSC